MLFTAMSKVTVFLNFLSTRSISTTAVIYGKRNFRKFMLHNKRGTRIYKKQQIENPDPDIPVDKRGVRDVGHVVDGKFAPVAEMIPELIVPDLTNFTLKPYVSYKAPKVIQSEFTSKDLFAAVYSKKIIDDFKAGQLDEEGNPLEPSYEERLTAEQAKINARKTGSDIF